MHTSKGLKENYNMEEMKTKHIFKIMIESSNKENSNNDLSCLHMLMCWNVRWSMNLACEVLICTYE